MKNILLCCLAICIQIGCTPRISYQQTDSLPDTSHIVYEGGSGKSYSDAIIITKANNSLEGITSEYDYVAKNFGNRGTDWNIVSQAKQDENGRIYDVLVIQVNGKPEPIALYFDITAFYGKL